MTGFELFLAFVFFGWIFEVVVRWLDDLPSGPGE